jgi:hypothetical protein
LEIEEAEDEIYWWNKKYIQNSKKRQWILSNKRKIW